MGPRLVGRGKNEGTQELASEIARLQWGRVLWDAESLGQIVYVQHPALLQWGRVLWDAERSNVTALKNSLSQASMGPRLVGRGKDL